MHVSLSPSVPPRSRVPTRAGETLLFYSSASRRGAALRSRVWAEANATLIRSVRESGQRKKSRPLCGRTLISSAKRQCSAAGRCFALSLTAGAPPHLRARSRHCARFFRLETGPLRGRTRTLIHHRFGPSGASTFPRIWIRSINARIFPVKRKTQNVVDVFVLRLFVVVPFPLNRFPFNTFRVLASHATLSASYSI